MPISTARKVRGPQVPNDFEVIRDISAGDLDDLFRQATSEAAKQALGKGLSVTGIDDRGRVVITNQAIRLDPISSKNNFSSAK